MPKALFDFLSVAFVSFCSFPAKEQEQKATKETKGRDEMAKDHLGYLLFRFRVLAAPPSIG